MHRHRAFTLVELLVAIAIIAILVALLVPAVQKVRAAAARAQCSNNLKQIGLAVHQYHGQHKSFPAGMRWQAGNDPYLYSSWLTHILPYIDQQQLWMLAQQDYERSRDPFVDPHHAGLSVVIPVYVCPSDPRAARPFFDPRRQFPIAFTCYLGVAGKDVRTRDGILFRDSQIRMAQITDGTSNTLLAGERPPSTDMKFGHWYAGTGQGVSGSGDMLLGVFDKNYSQRGTNAACLPGPYPFAPGDFSNQCDMFHFWSPHSGGAHFLFADGTVRFIQYSAAPIMPALASRAGGESVELP